MQTCHSCGEKNLNSATLCEDCGDPLGVAIAPATKTENVPHVNEPDEFVDEGYIRAHFNGNQTLWRSFWINWASVNFALDWCIYRFLVASLPLSYEDAWEILAREFESSGWSDPIDGVVKVWVVFGLLRIPIGLWQFVGLWRSVRQSNDSQAFRWIVNAILTLNILVNWELLLGVALSIPFLIIGPKSTGRRS